MITFLIPTFREKDNINLIVSNIDKLKISYHYNIYFVDDNSNDGSIDIFNELSKNYNNIRYHIRKNNKRDLTKSILEGLENINSDYDYINFSSQKKNALAGVDTLALREKISQKEDGVYKLRYRFDGPPTLTSVRPGISNVQCKFVACLDGD